MYVSRAGAKLEHALSVFKINLKGKTCADFGSSTGGFTDCLLQHGSNKVYSIDVACGSLDWKLRNDKRVVVMEKQNAVFVTLPEKVDLIAIDIGWTRQKDILPNAIKNLKENGIIVSLIKPHYEASKFMLTKGVLEEKFLDEVLQKALKDIEDLGIKAAKLIESPIEGLKGGNKEFLVYLLRSY
jgi:23S rRNA (cytidine1920-2'-O)/16S rRNA (cytidine1409-2'-O)-methyltransferase